MPRLTNHRYLLIRHVLRRSWTSDQDLFGRISAQDQWDVHAYFRPSEQPSEAELLQHRVDITKQRPSLPQRAGKALRRMTADPVRPVVGKRGPYVSSAIVNPNFDPVAYLKLVIKIVQNMDKPRRPGEAMDEAELIRRFSPERHRRRQQDPHD